MKDKIIQRLHEMRLPAMAAEFELLHERSDYSELSTDEIMEKLVECEYYSRKYNTVSRNIKQARFSDSSARLENIDYDPSRKINAKLIEQLSTNEYIENHRNVMILGATGCGKSYIGNALGNNACQSGYKVLFARMTDLLETLSTARIEGNIRKALKKYVNIDLLIIDDFLLSDTTSLEQKDLMEIFEYRSRGKSTIICSQCSPSEWHEKLGGGYIADAILDRITNNCYKIVLQGDSQRAQRSTVD